MALAHDSCDDTVMEGTISGIGTGTALAGDGYSPKLSVAASSATGNAKSLLRKKRECPGGYWGISPNTR